MSIFSVLAVDFLDFLVLFFLQLAEKGTGYILEHSNAEGNSNEAECLPTISGKKTSTSGPC